MKKTLKNIWFWLPGLYRVLICLSPICGILIWVYLLDRDKLSLIQSVLLGLGYTIFFAYGAVCLALIQGLVSLILKTLLRIIRSVLSFK